MAQAALGDEQRREDPTVNELQRRAAELLGQERALFVPTLPDWQALALPAPLHPLYYAIRPLRLSKTYLWYFLTRGNRRS